VLLTFNITIRVNLDVFEAFLDAFSAFLVVAIALHAFVASILAYALASRATWQFNSFFLAFAAFSVASLAFFPSLSSISLAFLAALSAFSYSSYTAFLAQNSRAFFTSLKPKKLKDPWFWFT
jgi:CHASE2 domain-containing sensor protein